MLNANVTIKTNDNNNSEQIHWYTIDWQDINKRLIIFVNVFIGHLQMVIRN
ncbi:hypothetical protein RHORCCE3_2427 [Rickettsia hoogstraalii str. RCCE3]|nr:hypothetical protein RHORCCE3_2427 [Rickettsia hoogstraalii str. RCCE3]